MELIKKNYMSIPKRLGNLKVGDLLMTQMDEVGIKVQENPLGSVIYLISECTLKDMDQNECVYPFEGSITVMPMVSV